MTERKHEDTRQPRELTKEETQQVAGGPIIENQNGGNASKQGTSGN